MFSKTPEISDFVCVLRGYYTIETLFSQSLLVADHLAGELFELL